MERRIRFGFRSEKQLPLFLIWREFWEGGEVVFAEVIFKIDSLRRALGLEG